MRYKVTFVVGVVIGYVLGTRAGRERYEQIKRATSRFADNPRVHEAAGAMQTKAVDLTGTATHKVAEKLHLGGHDDEVTTPAADRLNGAAPS